MSGKDSGLLHELICYRAKGRIYDDRELVEYIMDIQIFVGCDLFFLVRRKGGNEFFLSLQSQIPGEDTVRDSKNWV